MWQLDEWVMHKSYKSGHWSPLHENTQMIIMISVSVLVDLFLYYLATHHCGSLLCKHRCDEDPTKLMTSFGPSWRLLSSLCLYKNIYFISTIYLLSSLRQLQGGYLRLWFGEMLSISTKVSLLCHSEGSDMSVERVSRCRFAASSINSSEMFQVLPHKLTLLNNGGIMGWTTAMFEPGLHFDLNHTHVKQLVSSFTMWKNKTLIKGAINKQWADGRCLCGGW